MKINDRLWSGKNVDKQLKLSIYEVENLLINFLWGNVGNMKLILYFYR